MALTAKRNLLRSMNSLKEMAVSTFIFFLISGPPFSLLKRLCFLFQSTWPGAMAAYELLIGLVDLRDVNLEEPLTTSTKRSMSPVAMSSTRLPQPQPTSYPNPNPNPLEVVSQQRSYEIFGIPGHQNPQPPPPPPPSSSGGGGLNDILSSYFGGRSNTGDKVYMKPPHPQSNSSVGVNQNDPSNVYPSNSSFGVPDYFGQ